MGNLDISEEIKQQLGIFVADEDMTESQIQQLVRHVGEVVGRQARYDVMMSLTLIKWPVYYEKHSLSQYN